MNSPKEWEAAQRLGARARYAFHAWALTLGAEMSYTALAKMLGVARQTISRLMGGYTAQPGIPLLRTMVHILMPEHGEEEAMAWLMHGVGRPPTMPPPPGLEGEPMRRAPTLRTPRGGRRRSADEA